MIISLAICMTRAAATLRSRRAISIVWILLSYFTIFCFPLSLETEIELTRGFDSAYFKISHLEIRKTLAFILCFNSTLLIGDLFFSKLLEPKVRTTNWNLDRDSSLVKYLLRILLCYWLVGSLWYYVHTRGLGYRDYVEGTSWAAVFLWASSPAVVIAAFQRRWVLAAILCLPFMYFAVHLSVRSFALLSIVPLMVVVVFQGLGAEMVTPINFRKLTVRASLASVIVIGASALVGLWKPGVQIFPDSGMPYGAVQTISLANDFGMQLGFNSLLLYAENFVNPFLKLFQIDRESSTDTPVFIAGLLEGVPFDWPVYFHYPTLIWSDAYISFGWSGVWFGILWALILVCWDRLIGKHQVIAILTLPYFCWHGYMLVRGAIAVSSVPFAYAAYFSFFAFLLAKVIAQSEGRRESVTRPVPSLLP